MVFTLRNNTKLKHLLLKYTVSFDMQDDGIFKLMLTDKINNETHLFEGKTYVAVMTKAHQHLMKELKNKGPL